jgi:hypothetical protein
MTDLTLATTADARPPRLFGTVVAGVLLALAAVGALVAVGAVASALALVVGALAVAVAGRGLGTVSPGVLPRFLGSNALVLGALSLVATVALAVTATGSALLAAGAVLWYLAVATQGLVIVNCATVERLRVLVVRAGANALLLAVAALAVALVRPAALADLLGVVGDLWAQVIASDRPLVRFGLAVAELAVALALALPVVSTLSRLGVREGEDVTVAGVSVRRALWVVVVLLLGILPVAAVLQLLGGAGLPAPGPAVHVALQTVVGIELAVVVLGSLGWVVRALDSETALRRATTVAAVPELAVVALVASAGGQPGASLRGALAGSVLEPVTALPATAVLLLGAAALFGALVAVLAVAAAGAAVTDDRRGTAAVAASALFAGTLAIATTRPSPWLAIGGVAAAVAVWQLDAHAIAVGRLAGDRTAVSLAEGVQAVVAVAVTLVGCLLAAGIVLVQL